MNNALELDQPCVDGRELYFEKAKDKTEEDSQNRSSRADWGTVQ